MSKHHRKLANLILRPNLQLGLLLQMLSLVMTSSGATLAFSWLFFYHSRLSLMIQEQGGDSTSHWLFYVLLGGGMIFVGILTLFVTLLITHRIVGPMVAINRHLDALIEGNYSGNLRLRKNDEFSDVADKINLLTERLRTRQN